LRLVIGSLIVFSLIIFFLFALFPSHISVTRLISINRSQTEVLNKISDLRTWKSWNGFLDQPGSNADPARPTDSAWSDYLRVNGAVIRLVNIEKNGISTLWERGDRMFTGRFLLQEKSGQTILVWTLEFHVKWYPWEKLASMFYNKQLGPVMEKSLVNLRDLLEKAG
jgi:Polyketide cyclase / dehydrase and lipid transport